MRYSSIDAVLPMLKLTTGNPNIDQLRPELARMVGFVERNLGLSKKALHAREAKNIEVVRCQAQLPADFFEENQLLDCCMHPDRWTCDRCTCSCDPCCCGYAFYTRRQGEFTFSDCVVDCPFTSGTVSFSYWGMEMDKDGLPMILEGHVEAFCAYVTQLLMQGMMNSGQAAPWVYQLNKQAWEQQSLVTRSRDNVPSKRSVLIADAITNTPLKFSLLNATSW